MGKKPRFVTVFPECERIHLKKDVGMIPYQLGKLQGYDFALVSYPHESFRQKDIREYHLEFVPPKYGDEWDFARYLIRNAKKIDILNLYHLTSRRNLLWIAAYKLFHPSGKVYIKLDADYRMPDMVQLDGVGVKKCLKTWLLRKKVDLYTAESTTMQAVLEKQWKLPIRYLPNGLETGTENTSVHSIVKKPVFLTVGRLGTEQKATEDIVEAFVRVSVDVPWDLWLVGPCEESFQRYLEQVFDKNPELRERVVVFGNIGDAQQLEKIYREASVFVLSSRWESFGFVILEALYSGDQLILSDAISSADDLSRQERYAEMSPCGDVARLASCMRKATKRTLTDEELAERRAWVSEHFSWKAIISTLDGYLKNE